MTYDRMMQFGTMLARAQVAGILHGEYLSFVGFGGDCECGCSNCDAEQVYAFLYDPSSTNDVAIVLDSVRSLYASGELPPPVARSLCNQVRNTWKESKGL